MKVVLLFLLLITLVSCFRQQSADNNKLNVTKNEELQIKCGKRGMFGGSIRKGYGSKPVKRSVAPWAVAISKSEDREQGIEKRLQDAEESCSGTLISSRHVITAAHCVFEIELKNYLVIVDDDCSDAYAMCKLDPYHVREIKKVFYPANFPAESQASMHSSDIAVIELNSDIPFSKEVYPACMANNLPQVGDALNIYGFGTDTKPLGHSAKLNGLLQIISTKVVDCKMKTKNISMEYDHFCTNGDQHICWGDSGAGLISDLVDGTRTVVGISSNGMDCHVIEGKEGPEAESDDSNVRVAPHSNWICNVTGICPHPFTGHSYQGKLIIRGNVLLN